MAVLPISSILARSSLQLDSSLLSFERQSTWRQTFGCRRHYSSVVILGRVRGIPSSLEEMPVHWSGGTVECGWVDHGATSCLLAACSSLAKILHTLSSSDHGEFGESLSYQRDISVKGWTYDIITDTQPDLPEWSGESGNSLSSGQRIGFLIISFNPCGKR